MKVVIVGGVAAGASAAARLRRLDEFAEIVLLEKGKNISYANCGLPYHLGGVIPDREDLLVMPVPKFSAWFNVEVRTENEVLSIDRAGKTVLVRGPAGEYAEPYDKLLLATGAVPAGPAFEDAEYPHVKHLWTLADLDKVMAKLPAAKHVAVVGAGFIGLEVAENLRERGMEVTIIQRGDHVLPVMDREMAQPLADELRKMGVEIRFGCTVAEYREKSDGVELLLDCGQSLPVDLAIVAAGVRPNSGLARDCGLDCGARGHITVNENMQTSDPDIYAAGDAVEVYDPILKGRTAIPLAGPANKQGRIAADNMAGIPSVYRGSIGTSVVKVGHLTAGSAGVTESRLAAAGIPFQKIYLHPSSSAGYYPGAARLSLKVLFGADGTVYGAQAVGVKGVDKRIDSIAQAIRNGLAVQELGELELAYAPPYSSAKDPVNFAGFIAGNILAGRSDVVYPDTIPEGAVVVDVREPGEHELSAIPGAVNIPLGQLRGRLAELDKETFYVVHCQVGLRGYLAERILKQHGFRCANLSGGWVTYQMFFPPEPLPPPQAAPAPAAVQVPAGEKLDVRSLPCPGPVVKLKNVMDHLPAGGSVHVLAALTFEGDLLRWAQTGGHLVANLERKAEHLEADVVKSGASAPVVPAGKGPGKHGAAIVLFSNDFDKAMAALILANGLAAAGAEVGIFFTFWGLSVLRKNPGPAVRKNFISRMFGWMLPKGAEKLALSKMNMMGMGSAMMKGVMKEKKVLTLPELLASARAAGVKFIACDMAMDVMGITREELIDVDEVAGVAAFAELAAQSNNTLFI